MPPDRIQVLGVPFNSSGSRDGVARAPAALRSAGLIARLRAAGLTVHDAGDVAVPPSTTERDPASGLIGPEALASTIDGIRAAGGDCPVLLGCLGGPGQARVRGLLFVDGHEDAWPPHRSPTGEAADSELALALGLSVAELPSGLRDALPRLDPATVVVFGPRDEAEIAAANVDSIADRVELVRPDRLGRAEADRLTAVAVDRLDAGGPWWLHVDLDVLSTGSLAAVDYRQPGGLDWEALTTITRRALGARGAVGWTVTIYNPDLDPSGSDAARIVRYIAEAAGSPSARGR
jgi:arginase